MSRSADDISKTHFLLGELDATIAKYKPGAHAESVAKLRTFFDELQRTLVEASSPDNAASHYDRYAKWKIAANAFDLLSGFINAAKLEKKSAMPGRGYTYSQLIGDLGESMLKLSSVVVNGVITASTKALSAVESKDATRIELGKKIDEVASLKNETETLTRILSGFESTEKTREIERLGREVARLGRGIERSNWEVERLRKYEKQPDHDQIERFAKLEAEIEKLNKKSTSKDDEIADLKKQLEEKTRQLSEKEVAHKADLAQLEEERKNATAMGENVRRLEQQVERVLGDNVSQLSGLQAELANTKSVLAELHKNHVELKNKNEELGRQLGDKLSDFLDEKLGVEIQVKSDLEQQNKALKETNAKYEKGIGQLQDSFDTLVNAANMLLAKTIMAKLQSMITLKRTKNIIMTLLKT
jgi:chromosome segregation ATPase